MRSITSDSSHFVGTQTASSAGHHADVVRSESTASSPRAIQDIVDLLLGMSPIDYFYSIDSNFIYFE